MRKFARLINAVLRFVFHLLYHQMAWSYDLVAAVVSAGQWQRWVLSTQPYLPGPRVLELGHGPGHLQAALLAQGIWVCGIDESVQMGRQALRRLRRKPLTLRLARGLVQALPFPAHSFDQVAATFPTNYIYEAGTLAEIYRVLQPGGLLVVLPGAVNTGRSLPELLAALIFRVTLHAAAERKPQDYAETILLPFRRAGFRAELREIDLPGSRIFLITARKD